MGNRPLSNRLQKDRMMRKASAGVLCFVAILFLLAGPVPMGVAQDADAPPVAAEPVSAETVVAPAATAPASGGLADLAAMRTASAAAETTSEPEPVPAPAPRPTPEERLATLQDADLGALAPRGKTACRRRRKSPPTCRNCIGRRARLSKTPGKTIRRSRI
jgi:hypothetical protein